jgi:hypothetical protein
VFPVHCSIDVVPRSIGYRLIQTSEVGKCGETEVDGSKVDITSKRPFPPLQPTIESFPHFLLINNRSSPQLDPIHERC